MTGFSRFEMSGFDRFARVLRPLMAGGLVLAAFAVPVEAAEPSSGQVYTCWSLADVLEDLQQRFDLPLMWSSSLVGSDQRLTAELAVPSAPDAAWLEALLAPFDLALRVDGASWMVVPGSGTAWRRRGSADETVEALLPTWMDQASTPSVWSFPGRGPGSNVPTVSSDTLIVQVDARAESVYGTWTRAAFELKQRIVETGSRHPALKVALQGKADVLDAVVGEGLAPYVHAYVYDDLAHVPATDSTARIWLRSSVRDPHGVLGELLDAARRGEQRVLFEHLRLDDDHRAFLSRLALLPASDLEQQPDIEGIESVRRRVFRDPQSGDVYLALQPAPGRHELRFEVLGDALRRVYPTEEETPVLRDEGALSFVVDGSQPYQIFHLEAPTVAAGYRDLDVADGVLIDPYEEVVKNQVFQRRQKEKFRSLDVMEYVTSIPQYAGGSRTTWEHRILQRKGKYSEYHHLGFTQNGVRYPEKKLLKGRLFRTESLIQFQPLEVELDETFNYRYLGRETIDGRPTYRIAFEAIPESGVERRHRVAGEVWLDVETHAHRRLKTFQKGLDGMVVFMERTYEYEWILDDGTCFWDWRRRHGSYVGSSEGRQYSVTSKTERKDFDYNRPDIDEVARQAYDSDTMIHVEVPPEGHRWLVKKDGSRRLVDTWETYPETGLGNPTHDELAATVSPSSSGPDEAEPEESSSRILADVHAFGGRLGLSMAGYGSEQSDEISLFPGLVFSHADLWQRGYQGYVALYEDFFQTGLDNPSLFGSPWSFSTTIATDFDRQFNGGGFYDEDGRFHNLSVRSKHSALRFALARSLGRRWSLSGSYVLRRMDFHATGGTDPEFVLPDTTQEHAVELEVTHRRPRLQVSLGVQAGHRADWKPWGFRGQEPLKPEYQVLSLKLDTFHPLPGERLLGVYGGYIKGFDLDRFSRRPDGRSRASLVGFPNGISFDEGVFAGADLGMSLFKKLPVGFRLDASHTRFESEDEGVSRAGISFRFRLNGPFKTDLWPSIRTAIYSSAGEETGKLSYGLVIQRRY